ncbi:MAG TPA: cell envelope integrity protein TolA [Gammaproteobacteria bacterium]|nr:cell envelope integrity protein TolA [Gammaproteobacteria bacterium]
MKRWALLHNGSIELSPAHYTPYFLASVLMHVLLLVFFIFSLEASYNDNQLPAKPGEIVQATIVDQTKVDEEVRRLKTAEKQDSQEQALREKQLTQKLEQLKHAREQEQVKLDQLKKDMVIAKQQEQERLAEIKIFKEKEQKQLEDLKREKEAEKKKLAALDDQRQAEQDRAKQMRQEREKEEKKKSEAKRKATEAKQVAAAKAAKDAAIIAERAAVESQSRITSEVQKVLGMWAERIKSNKREAFGLATDLYCKLAINVLPDGNVKVRLLQSSGNAIYDDLSIKAVYKSEPFELPEDPMVREQIKSFELGLRNDEGSE